LKTFTVEVPFLRLKLPRLTLSSPQPATEPKSRFAAVGDLASGLNGIRRHPWLRRRSP
jgi:hypothetical protein